MKRLLLFLCPVLTSAQDKSFLYADRNSGRLYMSEFDTYKSGDCSCLPYLSLPATITR